MSNKHGYVTTNSGGRFRPLSFAGLAICLSGLLWAGGCRDVSEFRSRTGGPGTPTEPVDQSISVYEVQSDDLPAGSRVTLRSVVVLGVDGYGGRQGGIFVGEPEGGPFSGVFVYSRYEDSEGLRPGDLVDIEGGEKVEFALDLDETGKKLTQIAAPRGGSLKISLVGSGVVPEPTVVDSMLLATDADEAEKWEGVLITLENIRVVSAPRIATKSDETLKEMKVSGPFIVQSGLTSLDSLAANTCLKSITGIGDYFFEYKIQPRMAGDIVVAEDDSDCLPVESGDDFCSDGIDNDQNGFTDCDDFSCKSSAENCIDETDIISLQKAGGQDTYVRLRDVVVVARAKNGKSVWVQDPNQPPGAHNGLYVYNKAGIAPEVAVGVLVTLQGLVEEFDIDSDDDEGEPEDGTLTEMKAPEIEISMEKGPEYRSVPKSLAEAKTEPFESVLLDISSLIIKEIRDFGRVVVEDENGESILLESSIVTIDEPVVGQCFDVQGVVDFNTFSDPDEYSLAVLSAARNSSCDAD